MNLELVLRQDYLPPTPVLKSTRFVNDKKIGSSVSFPVGPSLQEMLEKFGRLPRNSLFFGCTEDDLPVLLDLGNPQPGPILISGDAGAGKTKLLKTIVQFAALRYDPHQIQYGVVTDRPDEWRRSADSPHCVGVFPTRETGTANFVRALDAWANLRKRTHESVLLLIDDLKAFAHWNARLTQELHNILLRGPEKQIWTIATLNPSQAACADALLKHFHTQVFGYTKKASHPGYSETRIETLCKGVEFFLKESTKWTRFHIPGV